MSIVLAVKFLKFAVDMFFFFVITISFLFFFYKYPIQNHFPEICRPVDSAASFEKANSHFTLNVVRSDKENGENIYISFSAVCLFNSHKDCNRNGQQLLEGNEV